ncbi:MAG: hypothetical protein JST30_07075 [Armatimonadetes bacterium]|nr:hypothetical protein [Armatimonadota bacterium]
MTPANPSTPAQQAVRTNLRKAAVAYKNLTPAQAAAWELYAQTQVVENPPTGRKPKKTAVDAFVELAAKFLQVTPTGTVPTAPPAASYYGDSIAVTVAYSAGKATFTGSAPNSLNTRTELLMQRLPAQNRHAQKGAYRSKGFVQFVPGTLSFDVTVPPGYYAAAYRFVNVATGQATDLQPINAGQVTLALEAGGSGTKKKAA